MAFNVAGSAQVPLSVFGGTVSEMAPSDLPEGVSPDSQDVVFAPGSVASRPGLTKIFATPFPKGSAAKIATVTYAKSFVNPNSRIDNLYLDSNGNIWREDVLNTPGTYVSIGAVTPGTWGKSVSAFGREYIAVSDGQHGADVPLQWDGTNLDRVTQDGPGASPVVQNFPLPSVAIATAGGGAPLVLTVTSITTTDQDPVGHFYTTVTIDVVSGALGLTPGEVMTVAGNTYALFNRAFSVLSITSDLEFVCAVYYASFHTGTGGTATGPAAGPNLNIARTGNVVTVVCSAVHSLRIGYQVQVLGIAPYPVAGTVEGVANPSGITVSSIAIDNSRLSGIATVTTSAAHGLSPGSFVSITGVSATTVGTSISSLSWAGGVVTVTTSSAHKLSPGAVVQISGVTGATGYNTSAPVASVISPTVFTYPLVQSAAPAGTPAAGTVSLAWPIPETTTPTLFEVISCPTSTTFQVQLSYCDGTWSSGNIGLSWNGTFYVSAVPTTTSLQYQQFGPDVAAGTVGTSGTVTPLGQISAGLHQVRVSFLTRQGYLTRPSPPLQIECPGGQYLSITDLPTGPSNIVARVIQLTGAQGSKFFYIPTPAKINGQVVSTSTQIDDNTTTSVVLDFGDPTLFNAVPTSVEGNDLASQEVLDSALGFGSYASRLFAYGQRNKIQNLLSMSFDGGSLPSAPTLAAGWSVVSGAVTVTTSGHFGNAASFDAQATSLITQPACLDAYSAPIVAPNTLYKIRAWLKPSSTATGASFSVSLTSVTSGFSSSVSIAASGMTTSGGWMEGTLNLSTPASIPADLILGVTCSGAASPTTIIVDELSLFPSANPYTTKAIASYANNPEAFDGVTGVVGPADDSHPIFETIELDSSLWILTQDPGGRIHKCVNNGTTEPVGWPVAQMSSNCGVISPFATTKSQSDSETAAGGEEWFAWASSAGARIFSGDQPWIISQEIAPDWIGANAAGALQWSSLTGIKASVRVTAWALNEPSGRRIYFGLPTGTANTPNRIYAVDYRELNTAYQIAMASPVHIAASGRLIATDHSRKWTRWMLNVNAAALMFRGVGNMVPVFCAGNAGTLGASDGYANAYTLSSAKFTDDDYGLISPYYFTYFHVGHDAEQALQLGGTRKMLQYLTAFIAGLGNVTIAPYVNALTNAWAFTCVRTLASAPTYDLEWAGGSVTGQRIAFKISSAPATGTDNWFNLQKFLAVLKPATHLPIRGRS